MSTYPDQSDPFAEPGEPPDGALPDSALPSSSRLPLAGAILLAVVAEAFLVAALTFSAGTHLTLVLLGVPMISGLFALGSCLLASMALRGRERSAWLLLGIACLGILLAQGLRFIPPSANPMPALALVGSYPSVASIALIAQSIGFFLAFLLFPPPTARDVALAWLRPFFDGVLIVGAALVGVIYFVLLPLTQATNGLLTPARLTQLTICVSDLLLLGGLTFALRSIGARRSPLYGALSILGLAMLLLIGADLASIALTPDQPAPLNSALQAIWNTAYLCMGLGAMARLRSGARAASTAEADGLAGASFSFWQALPFTLTILVAGAIVVHAATTPPSSVQMLVALVCASLLVGLIGVRHLAGLFEIRRMEAQRQALEQKVALAAQQVEQLRSSQMAQARARQESLRHVLEALTRFSYGDYQARVGAVERDLGALAETLNVLLDSFAQQINDRERGRDLRLLHILTDALGRLALGELFDLPELPAPNGGGLEGMVTSVVQIRARLLNQQSALQRYEAGHYGARQQLEQERQQLEQEAQAQLQTAQGMSQALEQRLEAERQVAQAAEEQFQRERQRLQAYLQSAESRVVAAEAALQAAEEQMRQERLELERRLIGERQATEERLRGAPKADPARIERLRQRGAQLETYLSGQAERLHETAATLQTAAEVAQRLARAIQETAALPELQGAADDQAPAPAPEALAPAVVPAKPLSAMQMLERLAGLRAGDTAPSLPAIPAVAAPPASAPLAAQQSGPLSEQPAERVVRRLHTAAQRAEEIANGLQELAQQCILAGDESLRAAETTGQLAADLEEPGNVPGAIHRTALPQRLPRSGH